MHRQAVRQRRARDWAGPGQKLGIRFYDKEILKKAAEESGIVEELFEKADEKPTNSFLYSLSMGTHGQAMNFTNYNDYLTNDKLFLFQSNTIRDMAEKDSCVIIGRCADYILRGRKDMLSVFIHALWSCASSVSPACAM